MWPNPQETSDLVKFTEEILNGKLDFFSNCLKNTEKYRNKGTVEWNRIAQIHFFLLKTFNTVASYKAWTWDATFYQTENEKSQGQ